MEQTQSHKEKPCHRFGEALYASHQLKPECIASLQKEGEEGGYIVHHRFFHKQQHSHHFGAARYGPCLLTLGCMTFPHPRVEDRIVQNHFVRKRQPGRCTAAALYETGQRKPFAQKETLYENLQLLKKMLGLAVTPLFQHVPICGCFV